MVLPHIVKKALLRIDVLYFWMHLCYMKFIDHSFYSSSLKIKIVILSLTGQYIECMVDLDTAKSVKECKIIMSLPYVVKKTLLVLMCCIYSKNPMKESKIIMLLPYVAKRLSPCIDVLYL